MISAVFVDRPRLAIVIAFVIQTDEAWATAELATKIGWREHALRDAMRGKELPGVRRTAFGYHIEGNEVDAIKATLGLPPPKPNASRR